MSLLFYSSHEKTSTDQENKIYIYIYLWFSVMAHHGRNDLVDSHIKGYIKI